MWSFVFADFVVSGTMNKSFNCDDLCSELELSTNFTLVIDDLCSRQELSSSLLLVIDDVFRTTVIKPFTYDYHCVQNWNCQQTFYLWLMTCLEQEFTTNLLLVINNLCSGPFYLLLVMCSKLELSSNFLLVVGDVFRTGIVIKPFTCCWWCVPNWNCQESFYLRLMTCVQNRNCQQTFYLCLDWNKIISGVLFIRWHCAADWELKNTRTNELIVKVLRNPLDLVPYRYNLRWKEALSTCAESSHRRVN